MIPNTKREGHPESHAPTDNEKHCLCQDDDDVARTLALLVEGEGRRRERRMTLIVVMKFFASGKFERNRHSQCDQIPR